MLTKEQNERLCLVTGEADMGRLFRRYWIPFALASELEEREGPPIRVRLLGEDLVAFRDSQGRVGLLGAYCPHRGAPLFFGRNEECGLRCVYHGWKFDVDGRCLDMPSEPPERAFAERVRQQVYPTYEGGGVLWTFMGDPARKPPPPNYEWMRVPGSHFGISKTVQACNYLQAVEGGLDTVHSGFLHNNDLQSEAQLRTLDKHPSLEVEPTDYGFRYASLRRIGDGKIYLRVYQFLMPAQKLQGNFISWSSTARRKAPFEYGHFWVPIDDLNTATYNITYSPERDIPMPPEVFMEHEVAGGRGPDDLIPGTFRLRRNLSNDFLIDRDVQRHKTFTGIDGINTQDMAMQEGMGRITDRRNEHPGSSDRAIMALRRALLDGADAARAGAPVKGADPASCSHVRGADCILEEGKEWQAVAGGELLARW